MIANLLVAVMGLLFANQLGRLSSLPAGLIAPLVLIISLLGAYATNGLMGDVVVALVFGFIGYWMKKYGYSRVALIIALVLGTIAEKSFFQTVMTIGASSLVTRPISLGP